MTECYIWDTQATMPRDSDGASVYLDSPRAGGKYKITGTASSMLGQLDVKGRALLTTWLCDQRRAGVECPAITSDTISSTKTFQPLTTTERIERALLHFNQNVRVGQTITLSANGARSGPDENRLMAVTESLTLGELVAFLQMMEQMHLLTDTTEVLGLYEFTPTAQGWLKIDDLVTRLSSTTQAFVAMWFNDAVQAAYIEGIEPAIKDCGYRAVRIDQKEHNNKIDDEIIAEIRRSKFVVADFTCEKEKVRGGVYYEAGFAGGLGIPVIWTVAKDSLGDVHFDTAVQPHRMGHARDT
ncbi:hypothetical protein N2603_20320 [Bradyrhizobium huanghuaihaiense]|uniref:hypothetical protein n=1 Tax=Bradyrhizobium huanghuaihaiense TaxID=990078 RepID=UPI0021AAFED2|nr:hypothetical protein [Bradyrhizobium sp. CB3035]UWU80721.1 hypothetical protein N2603_20320 [Bradyrhizobium sp. CB3035]